MSIDITKYSKEDKTKLYGSIDIGTKNKPHLIHMDYVTACLLGYVDDPDYPSTIKEEFEKAKMKALW